MQAAALADGRFKTPGGHQMLLQTITNGYSAVDLSSGGTGKEEIFECINSRDRRKVNMQIAEWQAEGILYSTAARYTLNLPIFDLNDLCFAALFQGTIGNSRINRDAEYGTVHVIFGTQIGANGDIYNLEVAVGGPSNIPNMIEALQREAQNQKSRGVRYMRIAGVEGDNQDGGHCFNVDIDELLALDPSKMEDRQVYCIGDLNVMDVYASDISRLAIRKINEGFQLGEALFAEHPGSRTRFVLTTNYSRLFVYEPIPASVRKILARDFARRTACPIRRL
jgi:hypothetical protein